MSSIASSRMIHLIGFAALAGAALATGCGGGTVGDVSAPPPNREEPAAEPAAAASAGGNGESGGPNTMTVQPAGKGYLDAGQVKAALTPHQAALIACYNDRRKDHPFVSGDVKLQFQVQKTGQVGTAQLVESSVGDWAVEHCVLEVARHVTFARPIGGDGTAVFSLPLHFVVEKPAPVEAWTAEQVAPVVVQHAAELDACAGAAGGVAATDVTVTLYIGNRGEVKAVGFSSPTPIEDTWADCAARAVASWKFTDPMGKVVKAAFHFPPAAR
jgi:TonB family protein